jgi:Niemann-Pick C1 protein
MFTYAVVYLNYEQYVVLVSDASLSIGLALVAVFLIVMAITGSILGSFFVILQVALVIYFLLGLIFFWGAELNSISFVNTVIAIGLAVDYSAHIMHAYLSAPNKDPKGVDPPRVYKAR